VSHAGREQMAESKMKNILPFDLCHLPFELPFRERATDSKPALRPKTLVRAGVRATRDTSKSLQSASVFPRKDLQVHRPTPSCSNP